jgi:acetylornithine deacetylase
MTGDIEKLAFELCKIPSITGSESEVMAYVAHWLGQQGLIIEKIPVDDKRFNVLASTENRSRYKALLCTHLDTVSPYISPKIENAILWGRGACDAKGIASAMAFALLRQQKAGFNDIALLFTVGEEDASDGAKACAPVLNNRADYVIVGEPTELKAAYAQKGSLVFDMVAHGKEAHSSMPHLGESALHKLIDTIGKLLRHSWPRHEKWQETFINIGELQGGSMRNVLAGFAWAKGIMRTSVPNNEIISVITSYLSPGVNLNVQSSIDPFNYVVPEGFAPFLAGFGSDAPYLTGVGKLMLIGPGSLELAHKPDERIFVNELYEGCDAYEKIVSQLRR